MYVNIEFLDEEPLENVITSLHYHMDKTIFIGFHDDVEAYKKRTRFFSGKYCHVKEIKFIGVAKMVLYDRFMREHQIKLYVRQNKELHHLR